ncbi:MAG: hypothetical protein R2844_20990 [Caldilineales bacterium]
MHFDIFTLFPGMFAGPLDDSIVKRARDSGIVSLALHNIRDYAEGKHAVTDDYPYGGGGGMVMKPDAIFRAVETVLDLPPRQAGGEASEQTTPIILLTPQGRRFTQRVAWELAEQPRIALICGRYEGVDERVRRHLCTDEISVGDFVLSGGEIAAMLIVDAVTRLLPGALGQEHGADEDPTPPVCWSTPTTPARPASAAGRYRKCWSPATIATSNGGGGSRRFCAPGGAGPTCWNWPG